MRRTSLKTNPIVTSLLAPSCPTTSSPLLLSTTSSSTMGADTSRAESDSATRPFSSLGAAGPGADETGASLEPEPNDKRCTLR